MSMVHRAEEETPWEKVQKEFSKKETTQELDLVDEIRWNLRNMRYGMYMDMCSQIATIVISFDEPASEDVTVNTNLLARALHKWATADATLVDPPQSQRS